MNARHSWHAGTISGVAAIALALAAGLCGCGTSTPKAGEPSGVLPATAISGLAVTTSSLTPADVQRDSTGRGFTAHLARWGYIGGWQRTFQGESRRLTLVVSRSLVFRSPGGAIAFVSYLHNNVGLFYPFAQSRPLTVAGQNGWVIEPPLCACHMAAPLLAAVTVGGRRVLWLEINGPLATARLLTRLLRSIAAN